MAKKTKSLRVKAMPITQGSITFYVFSLPASRLFRLTQINQRSEDKTEGYQRALSPGRARAISRYIKAGGILPGAIIVSFDKGRFNAETERLSFPSDKDLGWVIDGQHRLAGAYEASKEGTDQELLVVGFLKLTLEKQVEFFITINREARGVPASLYIDLLKDLPRQKSERELTDERIADIARKVDADETSPFHHRIFFTQTAKAGYISLANFARVLRPHIARQSGTLGLYTESEQEGAVNNYFKALKLSFPALFKNEAPIFFRTVGFGGVWRAFPYVFNLTNNKYKSFSVASIAKIFAEIKNFDFEGWEQLGSGNAAEIQAGEDLVASLDEAFTDDGESSIALKLE